MKEFSSTRGREIIVEDIDGEANGGEFLSDTIEQQSSRIAGNLAFQLFADTIDSHLWVHASFTRHLVDVSQITVKAEVGLNISDSEVMP